MTTEFLGFIIIVGAIIVLLARRQLQKTEEDPEVMEASAGRLRYELEQSADEIINRMAGHIDHLEGLLREADYKTEMLQQRIDQLQKLQAMQQEPVVQPIQSQQIPAQSVVETQPVAEMQPVMDASQEPEENLEPDFSQLLESNMQDPNLAVPENVEYTENLEQDSEISAEDIEEIQPEVEEDRGISEEAKLALEAFREVSKNLEAAQNDMGLNIDISSEPEPIPEMESDYEVASEYESMPEAGYEPEQEYVSEPAAPVMEQQEVETVIEDPEIDDKDDATDIARKLLMAGYTPEDVARFTGLGMNAIALLKQIHKI